MAAPYVTIGNLSGFSRAITVIMLTKQFILFCFLLALAGGATAQQMYKVVDANGKVTFSDRPQADDKAKLSVMQSYTLRPVQRPKTAQEKAALANARRDAANARRAAANATPAPVVPAEVEELMVTIMGLSAFGGRFEIFCSDNESEGRAFSAATLAWKQRNMLAVEQQRRLLMLVLPPARRAELISREENLLAEEIAKVSGRTSDGRKQWCEGVVAELNSGRSDVNNPEMMAIPIIPYKAK